MPRAARRAAGVAVGEADSRKPPHRTRRRSQGTAPAGTDDGAAPASSGHAHRRMQGGWCAEATGTGGGAAAIPTARRPAGPGDDPDSSPPACVPRPDRRADCAGGADRRGARHGYGNRPSWHRRTSERSSRDGVAGLQLAADPAGTGRTTWRRTRTARRPIRAQATPSAPISPTGFTARRRPDLDEPRQAIALTQLGPSRRSGGRTRRGRRPARTRLRRTGCGWRPATHSRFGPAAGGRDAGAGGVHRAAGAPCDLPRKVLTR